MTKRGRYRPKITLAPVHERIADAPAHTEVAPIEVVDPYSHVEDTHAEVDKDGNEFQSKGARIIVMRSLRDDPLARLHARGHINHAAYHAGRRWQELCERSNCAGVQAIDFTKEPVDGGKIPEMISDGQLRAVGQLRAADQHLGVLLASVVKDVLGEGLSIQQLAAKNGAQSTRERLHWGFLLQRALDQLAEFFGLSASAPGGRRQVQGWRAA
jgi:hypothetical protein